MGSAPECGPDPVAQSFNVDGRRVATTSRRNDGYESLRRPGDFRRAFRNGTRTRVGGIVVVIVQRDEDEGPRVGFVTPRLIGGAVARNRARRRLREAMRQLELQAYHHYVVIADESVVEAPFPQLVSWLTEALGAGHD